MFDGIFDLFDLNGDGKTDGIEMAEAYTVLFGDGETEKPDSRESGDSYDGDWEE